MKINRLAAYICVVSSLVISACSTTPSQKSVSHQPATDTTPLSNTRSMGGLNSILSSPDINNPAIEPPYSLDANTVWPDIRNGFQLNRQLEEPEIDTAVKWYRNNPAFVYRATERSNRYIHYVVSELQQRNMPTELAMLPIVESAYDPFAYSRSGAAGMWQFLPGTGAVFGLKRTWWYDGRKDVVASTDAALTYLQRLHDMFDGDWLLAIAAYNFGEGSIKRAVDENRRLGKPTDFWSLTLREETRTYVPRLLALARIVNAPHNYGINLYAVPDRAYFAQVETGGQLELAKAAELADVDPQEIYLLNPGLSHWATDPQGPQQLLVPVAAADRFKQQLAMVPMSERGIVKRYDVAKGDTLASISRKFGVDPGSIRNANRLNDGLLHPGQSLLIPRGSSASVATADASNNARTKSATPHTQSGANQIFHTVVTGDTFRRVAQQYNVTPQEIQRWNGLDADSIIKLGTRLSIWSTTKAKAEIQDFAKASTTTTTTKTTTSRKVGYTVQNGDSLTAIASRFNIEIDDILRWNTVNSRALLQPGQKLTLYTRQ